MIPTIETIVEDLLAGKITAATAVNWLNQHAEDAIYEMRDSFACAALSNAYAQNEDDCYKTAQWAYQVADAMLFARKAKP